MYYYNYLLVCTICLLVCACLCVEDYIFRCLFTHCSNFFWIKIVHVLSWFYNLFFLHQQVQFFVFLSKFISEFIVFPQDCHKSISKSAYNEKSLQFDLWQFSARINPSLGSLICVGKFHKKLFLTLTVGSPHYMTLVTNTEQYNKGAKWS